MLSYLTLKSFATQHTSCRVVGKVNQFYQHLLRKERKGFQSLITAGISNPSFLVNLLRCSNFLDFDDTHTDLLKKAFNQTGRNLETRDDFVTFFSQFSKTHSFISSKTLLKALNDINVKKYLFAEDEKQLFVEKVMKNRLQLHKSFLSKDEIDAVLDGFLENQNVKTISNQEFGIKEDFKVTFNFKDHTALLKLTNPVREIVFMDPCVDPQTTLTSLKFIDKNKLDCLLVPEQPFFNKRQLSDDDIIDYKESIIDNADHVAEVTKRIVSENKGNVETINPFKSAILRQYNGIIEGKAMPVGMYGCDEKQKVNFTNGLLSSNMVYKELK